MPISFHNLYLGTNKKTQCRHSTLNISTVPNNHFLLTTHTFTQIQKNRPLYYFMNREALKSPLDILYLIKIQTLVIINIFQLFQFIQKVIESCHIFKFFIYRCKANICNLINFFQFTHNFFSNFLG